jgi:hypothetical protein
VAGLRPARKSVSCRVSELMVVRAAISLVLLMERSLARTALVVVRLATAWRSAAVAVARLAMASMVSS